MGVDAGSGEEISFDSEQAEVPQEVSQPEQTETNPAWNDLLNDIPEGFRDMVSPHLKKWDEDVNKRFESRAEEVRQAQEQLAKYQPYADLVENNVDPQQIRAANVLLQELTKDPKAFYQRLGEHYGFTQQQIDSAVANHDPDNYDDDENTQVDDPRYDQLAQQQQAVVDYISAQAQLQVQQQANQEIDNELQALDSQVEGGLSQMDRREVLQRAILMGQTNPNVTLAEAYNQWQDVKRQMFENTQNKQAPRVVSSGGSANPATPNKRPSEMSDTEFRSDIVSQLMNLKG